MKAIHLTPRDRDLIQGVLDGKRNKEIAFNIGVTENSVKVYMCLLFSKLRVDGRHGLANWGRAYAEAQRAIAVRFRELFPDQTLVEDPTFSMDVAEFDVFRTMAQTLRLTPERSHHIIQILTTKGNG